MNVLFTIFSDVVAVSAVIYKVLYIHTIIHTVIHIVIHTYIQYSIICILYSILSIDYIMQ
jgi:hypothetical protein